MLKNAEGGENMEQTIAIESQIQVAHCPEGERLYQAWVSAIELHVPSLIYETMKDYFTHKNGVRNYMGMVTILGCRRCGFVIKED
jgi:hypothetical protein